MTDGSAHIRVPPAKICKIVCICSDSNCIIARFCSFRNTLLHILADCGVGAGLCSARISFPPPLYFRADMESAPTVVGGGVPDAPAMCPLPSTPTGGAEPRPYRVLTRPQTSSPSPTPPRICNSVSSLSAPPALPPPDQTTSHSRSPTSARRNPRLPCPATGRTPC